MTVISMYKTPNTVQQESNDSLESKYTVAEILSSMTSGEPPITPISFASGLVPNYPSSGASILTPTTLANLEQTFVDLNNSQTDPSLAPESGFVPPVVNPIVIDPESSQMGIKREYDPSWDDDLSSCSSTDPEWSGSGKRYCMDSSSLVPKIDPNTYLVANSRRPTGPRRNKRDEKLTSEEIQRKAQRRERNKVAAAKCRQRRVDQTNVLINETENLEEEKSQLETEIQSLQQQKEQLEFLLNAHKPMCKVKNPNHNCEQHNIGTSIPAVSYMSNMTTPRPSTLPLRTTQAQNTSVTSATGIPITTPSSMFGSISLDTMLDGHTGLTPLTGQAPSCGSQVQLQRTSSDSSSEMGSPNSNLISL